MSYELSASESDIGTTTFPALELGFGARGAAMGNAFCAMSDDISALWWNPAGLGQLQLSEVSFSHQQWFQDFKDEYGGIAYCTPMGTLATGVIYSSVSGIEGYPDEPGAEYNDPTNFKTYDVVGSLAYGKQFKKNLYFGLSFLGYYMNLNPATAGLEGDVGKAFGANLGFLWKPNKIGIGLSIQNLGTQVNYLYHASDYLPRLAKLGISLSPSSKLNSTVELTVPQFGVRSYGAGLEYWLSPLIAIRGGYRGGPQAPEYFAAKDALSVGFGIRYLKFGLDYAYAPYADLGMTHRISLNYVFGKPKEIKTGTIIAKVIDSDTRKPLQAIVTTKGPRCDTVLTSPESGERKITDIPIGQVIVKAEKDFYTPPLAGQKEDTVTLAWYDIKTVELELKYIGPKGVPHERVVKGIFGKVSSVATGAPVMADIQYEGPVSGMVMNDTSGWYTIRKIPAGMYTLAIESKGHDYFPKTIKEVVVEKDQGTLAHAELSKVKTLRLYFERDRAYVHPNDRALLDTLASFIQQYKENAFEIHGHTDPRPPTKFKDNMELSHARANAVKDYLVSRGIAIERLGVKGFGATKPVASNDTEEGMATNRRIEIIMSPPRRPAEAGEKAGHPPVKQLLPTQVGTPAEEPKVIEQKSEQNAVTPTVQHPDSTKK